jgi:hypothetical protein
LPPLFIADPEPAAGKPPIPHLPVFLPERRGSNIVAAFAGGC